jgi:GlpG protein
MRLLHTFHDPASAKQFSDFLKGEGIDNQCEIITTSDWGNADYGTIQGRIWIIDEDQHDKSEQWLNKFLQNPKDPIFFENVRTASPLTSSFPHRQGDPIIKERSQKTGIVTLSLVIACILIFIYGVWTTPKVPEEAPHLPLSPLYSPKINKDLMYDWPKVYEYVDLLIKEYGYDKLLAPQELPLQAQLLYYGALTMPTWNGIYDQLVEKVMHPTTPWNFNAPMFEKIRAGEVWRIVSPILLHANEFHIFFNLLWLLMLGRLIEERIGPFRFIALILVIAAVSNTAQYLISGPNFLGISGVIVGLLGFIWVRDRKAAWEGYQMNPSIVRFMFMFVMGLFALQFVIFVMHVYTGKVPFSSIGIANTAHIVGGLTGIALGYLKIFAKKNRILP